MEITSSDKIDWPKLFLEHDLIIVNYQPQLDCPGCKEMTDLFEKFSRDQKYEGIKFMWIDSRNNPVAEQFIKSTQTPFIATFKEGFLVECDNISKESDLKDIIDRLFEFKFKL